MIKPSKKVAETKTAKLKEKYIVDGAVDHAAIKNDALEGAKRDYQRLSNIFDSVEELAEERYKFVIEKIA